jgi:signal transduction histidine kinase/streptogramin lyase
MDAKKYLLLFISLLGLGVIERAEGQMPWGGVMVYQQSDGIAQFIIKSVVQGKDGFLWMATENGLVRFDGFRYDVVYAGEKGLTDNMLNDVAEDDGGNLWVAAFVKGITRYNPRTQQVRRWPVLLNDGQQMQTVYKVLMHQKQVWLGTIKGLGYYDKAMDSFRLYKLPETSQRIRDIVADKKNPHILWLAGDYNVYSFNTESRQLAKLNMPHFAKGLPLSAPFWHCIDQDNSGNLFLGGWQAGLRMYDPASGVLSDIMQGQPLQKPLKGMIGLDVKFLNDSTVIWACSTAGVLMYNPQKRLVSYLNASPEQLQPHPVLKNMDWHTISQTKDAGIFAGGTGTLLQWHPAYQRLHSPIRLPADLPKGIILLSEMLYDSARQIHLLACAGKAQMLWTDKNLEKATSIKQPGIAETAFADVAKWPNSDDYICISYFSGNGYRIPSDLSKLTAFSLPFRPNGTLRRLENDKKGGIWLVSNKTGYYINNKGFVQDSIPIVSKVNPTANVAIHGLALDNNDRLWVATNLGLFILDAGKPVAGQMVDKPNGGPLKSLFIKSICSDVKNALWVGYNGEGLQRIGAGKMQVTESFDIKDLPGSQMNELAISSDKRLFAATPQGLAVLTFLENGWQVYDVKDGLPVINLDNGMKASTTGKMVLSTGDELLAIDNEQFSMPFQKLQISITNVRVNTLEYKHLVADTGTFTLNLPYDSSNIELVFSAHQWLFPKHTKYFYRWNNNDSNPWQVLLEPRMLLPALQWGTYQLQIKAIGAGEMESNVMTVSIIIRKPFWLQLWFIASVVIVVLGTLYFLYSYRLKQLRRTIEVRNTISQNLHDDIGASLSNIQMLNELTRRNLGNKIQAEEWLEQSDEDIRQVSESISDIVWNVNPRYDDLNNLFIRMKRYAADQLEAKNIQAALHFPENTQALQMPMEQRRDFYLIFKEAMHNLVKHSAATDADLTVTIYQRIIELHVTDNGKGFDKRNIKEGNGLANMQKRALKWKGSCKI